MKAAIEVELANGFKFGVESDVSTLADVRKIMKKADGKIHNAVRAVPEMAEEKIAKVRFNVESKPKPAPQS